MHDHPGVRPSVDVGQLFDFPRNDLEGRVGVIDFDLEAYRRVAAGLERDVGVEPDQAGVREDLDFRPEVGGYPLGDGGRAPAAVRVGGVDAY